MLLCLLQYLQQPLGLIKPKFLVYPRAGIGVVALISCWMLFTVLRSMLPEIDLRRYLTWNVAIGVAISLGVFLQPLLVAAERAGSFWVTPPLPPLSGDPYSNRALYNPLISEKICGLATAFDRPSRNDSGIIHHKTRAAIFALVAAAFIILIVGLIKQAKIKRWYKSWQLLCSEFLWC